MAGALLIAGSDAAARDDLAERLRARGHAVATAGSREELEGHVARRPFGAVFADPALLGRLFARPGDAGHGWPPLVLLTAAGETPPLPPEAHDVLPLPATAAQLDLCLARLHRHHRLADERDELRAPHTAGAEEILGGSSAAAIRLRERVARVAGTPRSTVLVTGEAGTEKELVARAIHAASATAAGPFRVHPCDGGGVRDFASALRGETPGEGLLTRAAGGSLFLAEVSALSPSHQALLATWLSDRTFRAGGDRAEEPLDLRVIASSSTDLEARTEQGRFLGDLYYRLNVLTVAVPPLRERREDLATLARHALGRTRRPGPAHLSEATRKRLAAHPWPGNLSELRSVLVRAAFRAGGAEIQPEHLGLDGAAGGTPGGEDAVPIGDRSLRTVEESLIRRVLEEEEGNRSRAARVLGINRSTLYNKMRLYGI